MRRISKKILIFLGGVIFTVLYCECLIYYVVVGQCSWPVIQDLSNNQEVLKAFILSDPHLLGPFRGHWLDKWRREWQMYQAFQVIQSMHKPDVVFILGDLFDEGEWTNNNQFISYVDRFQSMFHLPNDTDLYVVAGNHDIGFHNNIRRGSAERFAKLLKAPPVQLVTLKGNHFVLINSMAMEGDGCRFCTQARRDIDEISGVLKCAQSSSQCKPGSDRLSGNYSQPILMQHFPLYRLSDEICTEPDAPPLPKRNKRFRLKIDALSKEATEYLIEKIKPRAVFGGHTHHGCKVHHSLKKSKTDFLEYSVPSFSWRNRPDPKYMLVTITPDAYAVNKCGLPLESTIAITAVIFLVILLIYLLRTRTIGRWE